MLPKELLSARFKGLAPSAKALVRAAEQLSGMELRLDGNRVEFAALPGAGAEVLCNPRRRRVSIRHEGKKSPTLYLLLQHAIARLGGDIKPGELPFPSLGPRCGSAIVRNRRASSLPFWACSFARLCC